MVGVRILDVDTRCRDQTNFSDRSYLPKHRRPKLARISYSELNHGDIDSHAPAQKLQIRAGHSTFEGFPKLGNSLSTIVVSIYSERAKMAFMVSKQRSCPGEWCNSGEAVVITGKAQLIKLSRRRAA